MDAQVSQICRTSPLKLVELFALPGAGKSTVVNAFAQQALVGTRKDFSAEWAECSALQRLAHVGGAIANHRRLAAAIRFGMGSRLTARESRFRLTRLVAKSGWLRSRSGVVLLDQGFLQDIWSILLASNVARADPVQLSSLIRSLYQGIDATIVVLDVEPQTASARVGARTYGKSRFDGLLEGQLGRSIEAASALHKQIMEAARLAGLKVLVVDASPPADVVTDRLMTLFPAAPRPSAERTSQRPRRISVVGATGSGKTVLARQIAERLNLPYRELDEVRRQTLGRGSSGQTFDTRVADLALGDEWVFDGHYREVRHLIWSRAELVVWLNYPLYIVALRLIRRFRRKRSASASRADRRVAAAVTDGSVAAEGASWRKRLGRLARTVRERSAYGRLLRDYSNLKIVEMRSIEATRQWLRDL